jgi:hypothetical protein
MADKTYTQVELNRCAFLHTGAIESQCVYEAKDENEVLQNGEIVVIDKKAGKVYSVANKAAAGENEIIYGLNYTSERIYNQFTPGRKNFCVVNGEYPRIGILSSGDIFTTDYDLNDTYGSLKLAVVDADADCADGTAAQKYMVL